MGSPQKTLGEVVKNPEMGIFQRVPIQKKKKRVQKGPRTQPKEKYLGPPKG